MTDILIPILQDSKTGDGVLMVAATGVTYETDKSAITGGTSYWVSASLNRGEDPSAKHTLRRLFVEYMADAANGFIRCNFSGDGGVTWSANYDISVQNTGGKIVTQSVGPNVTGPDLRVKITISSTAKVRVVAITPNFKERGNP